MKRRSLLRWLLAVPILGIPLIRQALHRRALRAWDRDVKLLASEYTNDLRAVTRALLPSALARGEADAVALGFIRWLELQRPGAELSHLGARLRSDDPAGLRPGTQRTLVSGSNYIRQLEQIRALARPSRLERLDRLEMSVLLTSALQVSGAHDIPPGPGGANILLDLLSFFYRRPGATDLFHGRNIGALSCRGLDGVDQLPAPLPAHAQSVE